MQTKHFILIIFFIIIANITFPLFAEEVNPAPAANNQRANPEFPLSSEEWKDKVVVIPVTGVIAPASYGGQEENIVKAIQLASKASRIIMEIDSPGGSVESCDKICQALIASPAATTALIIRKAVSGGAMIATACSEIYMLSGSRIGDIQPMMMMSSQALDERTAEKAEADVRAIMASNAKHNGYPKVILESMVTRSFEIYEVNFEDGEREFLNKDAYDLLRKNMDEGIDKRKFGSPPRIVVTAGKLLSLEAQTAVEYGIATKVLSSTDEYYSLAGIDKESIVRVDLQEGELNPLNLLSFDKWKMSKGLTMLLILCLIIGVAGTFTEMNLPGFGIPGALGLIGFASFFTILFLHERATFLEVSLFVIGIVLIVVEIVLIPGFGVTGILGFICLLGGLVFSLVPAFDTEYMKLNFGDEMMFASLITGGVIVIGCVLLLVLMEKGGKSHFFKFLFLDKSLPEGKVALKMGKEKEKNAAASTDEEHTEYLGLMATAYTPLRPAGKIKTDSGELIDVVTPGEFIEKGSRVEIISVDMNRIVVDTIKE